MNVLPSIVFAGTGGTTNKADIVKKDNIQYFQFNVSSTSSSAKFKYKTIGWRIRIKPRGANEEYTGDYTYSFSGEDLVSIPLQDMFNSIDSPSALPQEYREVGGEIHVDAIQTILLYGVSDGSEYSNDASEIINGIKNKYDVEWSKPTQKDLPSYYNIEEDYDPVSETVPMILDLEVTSKIDDHTLDMSKGEGQAQVRIHASGTIEPEDEQIWAKNYKNIQHIIVKLEGQEKILYPDTDFTSLSYATDFTFNYLPEDIEDGDSDMNDTINIRYDGDAYVTYKLQYKGNDDSHTNRDLIKKAPIPDGDPLAILSVPDQVLVDEEILADGSGSIAPEGATIENYKWEVETKELTKEEGNSSIKLTYDEPKTVTVALTVEDSNGKTDTAMKDVKIIKKASPPHNWSPDVIISAPSIVMQGDNFTLFVNATDKEDGSLTPSLSKPSSLVLSGSVHNGDNTAKFLQSGIFTVTAKATDSGGKSDSASTQIEVCPPKPLAIISEDGDYKVGQTVILDSSNSKAVSKTYPIDWKLTNWTITPLGSLKNDDIYTKKLNDKEIAFTSKKTGKVEISLTVRNTIGYSNTRTTQRTIVNDLAPTADFKLIKKVYRDKDNDKKAIVRAFDMSKSPDGDSITKRAWFYAFDSDNDGIFSDDTWYYHNGTSWVDSGTTYGDLFAFADTVNTGNATDVTVETTHVGRYKFELKVYEEHDNRLLEFVDTSHILTDDTADKPSEECIAEVDNIAPVTAVKVDVSKNEVYDIVVVTDYKDMDLITLQTELNLLKAEAFANNKDFKVHMVTDKILTGKQHRIRNYYTYARNIYLSYYLESGRYEFSGPGGNREEIYNHDHRSTTIQYETTQGYTTPTISFQKGDKVEWQRGSFSKSDEGMYGGYEESGVEFRFFNPDNKIGTLSTNRITTQGWMQGINFCQTWNNIRVEGENVNITNYWTRTSNFTPHDFYYDIHAMDFSKVKDIPYTNDSKKVFLYFTKGTEYNYENESSYNYSATSLDKDFMDYLIYNDFETYVVAPNDTTLDVKFDNNNYSSDINSQYTTLRELAHCSPIRGKYILGDVNSELWKDQLMHTTNKNVVMPNKVSIENNVMRLTFDEDFKPGQELDLTLLQQEFKISDLVGNSIDSPKIEYDITVEDNDMKPLSSLYFSNPLPQEILKDDVDIIKIMNDLVIYKQNGQVKVSITNENSAKNKFTASGVEAIKNLDYTNVKDIQAFSNILAILYNNGTVKAFGEVYVSYYHKMHLDESKWRNIKQLVSSASMLVGIKYDGSLIELGIYGSSYNTYYRNNTEKNDGNNYYAAYSTKNGIMILYKSVNDGKTYVFGYSSIDFLPYRIEQVHHTTSYEVITSEASSQVFIKWNGRYYKATRDYNKPMELVNELNGMSIKRVIPIRYSEFIAVKSDDTLYFSESMRTEYTNQYHYPHVWSKLNNLGKFKRASFMNGCLWLEGTNGEFFLGTYRAKDTLPARYLKIDEINRVITNGDSNMIFIMKDGKRYDVNQYINALKVPSNATYYFADSYGLAYMTSNGYFYSSVIPMYNQPSYTWYNYRKFSGRFDKVVSLGLHVGMVGLRDGRVSVYKKDEEQYNYLSNVAYYTNVEDIFNCNGIVVLIGKDNNVNIIYRGNYPRYLGYYDRFKNKKISKFFTTRMRLYGIDTQDNVWRTNEEDGLKLEATDVEDAFVLNNTVVYLKKDGTLSQYGEGKLYEKYEGMLVTPTFITLKLKGREDKVCITPNGIQIGYIGGLKDKLEILQPLRSTQFHIGKHLEGGVAYKYKVFTEDKNSVEEILVNQVMDDTWTVVQDLDIVPVQDGYYIGVVEVNAENRAIRYSYMKAKAENL